MPWELVYYSTISTNRATVVDLAEAGRAGSETGNPQERFADLVGRR